MLKQLLLIIFSIFAIHYITLKKCLGNILIKIIYFINNVKNQIQELKLTVDIINLLIIIII